MTKACAEIHAVAQQIISSKTWKPKPIQCRTIAIKHVVKNWNDGNTTEHHVHEFILTEPELVEGTMKQQIIDLQGYAYDHISKRRRIVVPKLYDENYCVSFDIEDPSGFSYFELSSIFLPDTEMGLDILEKETRDKIVPKILQETSALQEKGLSDVAAHLVALLRQSEETLKLFEKTAVENRLKQMKASLTPSYQSRSVCIEPRRVMGDKQNPKVYEDFLTLIHNRVLEELRKLNNGITDEEMIELGKPWGTCQ